MKQEYDFSKAERGKFYRPGYKVQGLKSLREEMKSVARGERPAPADAAKPSLNSLASSPKRR